MKKNNWNINKILVWLFLWTAIGWLWFFSRTKRWRNLFKKILNDIKNIYKIFLTRKKNNMKECEKY